nr:hypothetical protein [Halomicroarcula sp. ZS-22-S1]
MGVKDQTMSQSEQNVEEQSVTTSSSEPVDAEAETVVEAAADTPPEPSLDLIFEILKNSRRREVIKYLRERGERVSLSDLAEHVAAVENGITTAELSSSQRKRVYVGLYQCHLPKMDDIGVVEFNQNRGHIELTDQAVHFEKYLDHAEAGPSRRWYQYYGGVSIVGVLVLALSVFAPVPGWAVMAMLALVVGIAGATSALHWAAENSDD